MKPLTLTISAISPMKPIAYVFAAFLLATTLTAQETGTPFEGRPNFIVIFIDDLGFADIQPFSDRHETPNLARMAEEGRTFTSFYSASRVCTPSRAAIMTGSYPVRVSMLHNETRDPLPQ